MAARIAPFALLSILAVGAFAQQAGSNLKVHHLIGLEDVKRNASGKLIIQNGTLQFDGAKTPATVPINAIDDVFVGSETTQGGGKVGTLAKTASMAAPYHTGTALTLLLRTKVDLLTVTYRDSSGALHGAIFTLSKGQAAPMRAQLLAAGAHSSVPTERLAERNSKEKKSQ